MSASIRILAGGCVLTQDAQGRVLVKGSVAVKGERIAMVGEVAEVAAAYPGAEPIDCTGKIIMPGLINAHTHVALNSCRGLSYTDAHSLYEIMWPLERYLTAQDVKDLAMVGILESLKAGTTTVADHYFFMEGIAEQVVSSGIRGVLGHTIMSQDGPFVGRQEMDEGIAFARRWKGRHARIHPVLAPHAPDTVCNDWLLELKAIAEAEEYKLHLHLAQTEREIRLIRERSGVGSVEYLKQIGFLGPRVVAAHCIFISDEEMRVLAESGATGIYCPSTHSLHGRGMRAVEILELGGKVALGTDCAVGNDDMEMFGEMRAAAMGQSMQLKRDRALRPDRLLQMATRQNAEALGVGHLTGSLEAGKQADILVLRADVPRMTPLLNPVANTVMCGSEALVHQVIVAGQTVVQEGRVLTVDEAEAVRRGNAAVARVMARAQADNPALFGELVRMAPGLA